MYLRNQFRTVAVAWLAAAALIAGGGEAAAHAADSSGNRAIELSELLRVIQFFNSGGYQCANATEDGFGPGRGRTDCMAHTGDYNRQDWVFSLSELLRIIQFYNLQGLRAACGNEDDHAPGAGEDVACGEPLLPDLTVDPSVMLGQSVDTNRFPGRWLLRFDSSIPNLGPGQFLIETTGIDAGDGREIVDQFLRRIPGASLKRDAGDFVYNPVTRHMEAEGWTSYRIREILPEDGVGPVLREGTKVSVNITSSALYDGTLPNVPPPNQRIFGINGRQGISVGYTDLYPRALEEQWVDFTGLPAGEYWLEMHVDPANHILEADETNNIGRVKTMLPDATGEP